MREKRSHLSRCCQNFCVCDGCAIFSLAWHQFIPTCLRAIFIADKRTKTIWKSQQLNFRWLKDFNMYLVSSYTFPKITKYILKTWQLNCKCFRAFNINLFLFYTLAKCAQVCRIKLVSCQRKNCTHPSQKKEFWQHLDSGTIFRQVVSQILTFQLQTLFFGKMFFMVKVWEGNMKKLQHFLCQKSKFSEVAVAKQEDVNYSRQFFFLFFFCNRPIN